MRILGIETSCDETGIAIVEVMGKGNPSFHILANEVSSQIEVHRPYGGVFPSLAKREHQQNLPVVLHKALKTTGFLNPKQIDAIAITVGPGLDPCLWTGIEFAKKLATQWSVPIVPVNHIEGHLLISLLTQNTKYQILNTKVPAISLIVSGGHTQLILVKKIGQYKVLGETRDDAAGECFDKTARILGLDYPGGPAVAAKAAMAGKPAIVIKLPRPMMHTKDYDFSFSGLKTAVLYDWKSRPERMRKSKAYIHTMAKEIQQAIIDVLIAKTLRATEEYGAKSIVLGGGVAANEELRKQLVSNVTSQMLRVNFLAAPKNLCTDNGLMIALAGYFQFRSGNTIKSWDELEARPNLRLA